MLNTVARPLWFIALVVAVAPRTGTAQSIPVAPFERVALSSLYLAEGACVGDFNGDGAPDIASGSYWWQGPRFSNRHAFASAASFPIGSYSDRFFKFVGDFNGDGWDDILTIGRPGQASYWYQNPTRTGGLWARHLVAPAVDTESPTLQQLIPGGSPELVCGTARGLGYLSPDPTNSTAPWVFHLVSPSQAPLTFLHGLGVGDVNGDGRLDVMTGPGWLEQPPSLTGIPVWAFHSYSFGTLNGSQMFAYDIDGDGDNDIVSSKNAHGYGLSWFERIQAPGPLQFVEHSILSSTPGQGSPQFSQLHALHAVDIDGDGLRDLVTGKTFFAHNGRDPGAFDPAVLYWFRLERSGGTATFSPHRIDSGSGVGRQVAVQDINGDGRPDIVVGNKKGVFAFRQRTCWSDRSAIALGSGGIQRLFIDAGRAAAGRPFWIVGSASGTTPGIDLWGLHMPLNPDGYTDFAFATANGSMFVNFLGTLDGMGRASAEVRISANLAVPGPALLHHMGLIWGAQAPIQASAAVPLSLF